MIYYAMLEGAISGLEQMYIVLNKRKHSVRHYLESEKLEKDLQEHGKGERIAAPNITFVDQPFPLGSGEAIYRTKEIIGEEPFALIMPDFLLYGGFLFISEFGRGRLTAGGYQGQGHGGKCGIAHAFP